MSEDSSSGDDGFYPSVEANPFEGKLEQRCCECGESFQCTSSLMTHYQSHNVQATCNICQVTFRRMTTLSTHLTKAHSDSPHCETCNLWFDNKWEFNKHQGTHSIASPPSAVQKKTEEPCPRYVAEDHTYGCANGVEPLTVRPSGGGAGGDDDDTLESRPFLASVETWRERPDPEVGYANPAPPRTLEVGDVEMEIPYQTKSDEESENTDDSENYHDEDEDKAAGGGGADQGRRGSAAAPGSRGVGRAEEKRNDEGSHDASVKDSDYNPGDKVLDSGSETSSSGTAGGTIDDEHCVSCGKGPFKNVKCHLPHCTGKRPDFQCSMCKRNFATEKLMQEHWMRLHACGVCNQVFTHWRAYVTHQCVKQNAIVYSHIKKPPSTVIYSCAPLIPNKCNLCKAFFPTEQDMLKHILKDHSKNMCIVPIPPSTLTVKHASDAVSTTEAQLVPYSPGLASESSRAACQHPSPVSLVATARKPFVAQSSAGSLPSLVLSSSRPGSVPATATLATGSVTSYIFVTQAPTVGTQVAPQKSFPVQQQVTFTVQSETKNRPPHMASQGMTNLVQFVVQKQSLFAKPVPSIPRTTPVLLTVRSPAVRPVTAGTSGQVTYRAPGPLFTTAPSAGRAATATTRVRVAPVTSSPPVRPLTVVAVFMNNSRELALKERMRASWRSKATYPCRHCGAVSRQPSLNVSHRYRRRGRRSHRCHCGRAFSRRLHLLRHCVQHAEATSYVCVSCGDTFRGARFLEEHMRGVLRLRSAFPRIPRKKKKRTRTACKVPLSCDCGQMFVRPSAYIWHQLKNAPKAKRHKKPSK